MVIVDRNMETVTELWADEWRISYQDDGRTIKLFRHGDGTGAEKERNKSLALDMFQIRRLKGEFDGVQPGSPG